jgi:hypothetical protein
VSGLRNTLPFAIVPEWLLDSKVSDRAIRLYAVLVRYADTNGRAFPARKRLAERVHCSLDSVDRATRELVNVGVMTVIPRKNADGSPSSNDYLILPGGVAAELRPPSRTGAEGGSRTGAAQNESHLSNESQRLDTSSDREFEEFFATFPTARKGSRRVVRKAWDKAIKRFPAHHIIVAAGAYRDDPNREDEFTKGAAVWLNNDCWEDPPLPRANGKPRRAAELPLDRVARELVEEMNGQHPSTNARDDAPRELSG